MEDFLKSIDVDTVVSLSTAAMTYFETGNNMLTFAFPFLAVPVYDNEFLMSPSYQKNEKLDKIL